MPAIITHHLFGEEAARRFSAHVSLAEEELLAFLLANQGPDPFSFGFTANPLAIQTCHELAMAMHAGHELEALLVARDAVAHLPAADQGIGRAFALGLLAHYLLDSEGHAFVNSQVDAICDAGVGLEHARKQVYALIQSELDTWMLWSARSQTINDAPAWADLARTPRVSRIAGTIFAQIAWQVFGSKLRPERYERCLHDYELVYKAIDPTGNRRGKALAEAERLGTDYSLLDALSHTDKPTDDCAAANLACHPWRDPLTGAERCASFVDVYYKALEQWPAMALAYARANDAELQTLMRRSYGGGPLA